MMRRLRARLGAQLRFIHDRWRYRNSPLPPLVFIGDSHANYFRHAAAQGYFGRRRVGCCAVAGATAVGLRNPNAKTNALARLSAYLRKWPPRSVIVIQLGEVDCGFVIWYRDRKYRDGVETQLEESIAAYFAFVDATMARGHRRIVVTGASMPTIEDGQDWGEVANARREVTASLQDRVALTRRYNERLRAEAARRGLPFIDISDEVLDPATGTVRHAFRNANPLDHHLDWDRAARSWAARLNAVL
jgi:hypothetical protein